MIALHWPSFKRCSSSDARDQVLIGIVVSPALAAAKWATSHAGLLGNQIAIPSPGHSPSRSNPAAKQAESRSSAENVRACVENSAADLRAKALLRRLSSCSQPSRKEARASAHASVPSSSRLFIVAWVRAGSSGRLKIGKIANKLAKHSCPLFERKNVRRVGFHHRERR